MQQTENQAFIQMNFDIPEKTYEYPVDKSELFNIIKPKEGDPVLPRFCRKNGLLFEQDSVQWLKTLPDNCVDIINKVVYTCQQSIGATLDALPVGESNFARKINGDLFERFIRTLISDVGINVREGRIRVPVIVDGEEQFCMNYQHDLIIEENGTLKAIGSVKTSSKDRIDKVFIDKFLYNRLTDSDTPHFAVFLNDVQRKGREPNYGINSTFLTGHFKGYTVKLSPLDGVYYCDMRPNMYTDPLLRRNIRSLDYLLVEDIWG